MADNAFNLVGLITRVKEGNKVTHFSLEVKNGGRTSYFDLTDFDGSTGIMEGRKVKVLGQIATTNIDRNDQYNLPKYLKWQPMLVSKKVEVLEEAKATNDDSDLPF